MTEKTSFGGSGATDDPDQWVDLRQIAKRLGVKPKTPQTWRARKLMPEPGMSFGGRPLWRWGVIEAWAIKTGRLS